MTYTQPNHPRNARQPSRIVLKLSRSLQSKTVSRCGGIKPVEDAVRNILRNTNSVTRYTQCIFPPEGQTK